MACACSVALSVSAMAIGTSTAPPPPSNLPSNLLSNLLDSCSVDTAGLAAQTPRPSAPGVLAPTPPAGAGVGAPPGVGAPGVGAPGVSVRFDGSAAAGVFEEVSEEAHGFWRKRVRVFFGTAAGVFTPPPA